jgi:3-phenylpropionate/trans-cinnamate dioxygenase ferredoxin reductase component
LQDYRRLRALADKKESFLVIGGGFIGSEIAAALTMVGRKVTLMILKDAIGASIFPKELSNYLNDFYRSKGVDIVPSDPVADIEKKGERFIVSTKNGRAFEADGVVAGLGIRPNVELAREAGLKIANGIVVNGKLQTSAPDIYAAGDVAQFHHSALDKPMRVEHEDNAVWMGKLAGRNMLGAAETYTHIPMFYSDLFELGYEAVGELSSKLETVSDWQEPFKKGVVYYLENERVRGVLLWNVWNKVDAARALMLEPGPFKASDMIGKITG